MFKVNKKNYKNVAVILLLTAIIVILVAYYYNNKDYVVGKATFYTESGKEIKSSKYSLKSGLVVLDLDNIIDKSSLAEGRLYVENGVERYSATIHEDKLYYIGQVPEGDYGITMIYNEVIEELEVSLKDFIEDTVEGSYSYRVSAENIKRLTIVEDGTNYTITEDKGYYTVSLSKEDYNKNLGSIKLIVVRNVKITDIDKM